VKYFHYELIKLDKFMKNYIHHHSVKYSILDVAVIVSIALFSLFDFLLLLRIVLENDFLAKSIWIFYFSALFFLSILYISHYRVPNYIYIIIFTGVLGISISFIKNASLGILINTILSYAVILLFYITVLRKKIHLEVLTKIILISSIIHLIGVIGSESFLKEGFDKYTIYGESSTLMGRSTGFLTSPGVLSFLAVFITVYSIVVYKLTSSKMALILFCLGLILGIYTGSRSFFVAIFSVLIIILFTLNYEKKGWLYKIYMISKYVVFLSMIIGVGIYFYSDLIAQTLSRFDEVDLIKSVYTRVDGTSGFYPNMYALINAPIFGPLEYSDKGPYSIYNGEKITVSNGMLSIFVSNGLILGSVYFSFYIRGFYLLWNSTRRRKENNELFVLDNALFYCYIGLTIVTITDALLGSLLMKLIIVYANTPRLRNYCKKIKW